MAETENVCDFNSGFELQSDSLESSSEENEGTPESRAYSSQSGYIL
jgi:hypothetical protein